MFLSGEIKADLLFSKIKADYPEYEYDIMAFCKQLTSRTKIAFESYDVLQVLHMIVKGRSRVDENANSSEIQKFKSSWDKLQIPLNVIFDDYLVGHFNITNMAIIRNKMPLLVLIVFFYRYYEAGKKFREISAENLKKIDRFFITAEINDWALQSYTDNFTKVILSNSEPTIFPLEQIEEYVARRGNRPLNITEAMFRGYRWMALKFIIPNRSFDFEVKDINSLMDSNTEIRFWKLQRSIPASGSSKIIRDALPASTLAISIRLTSPPESDVSTSRSR